MILYHAARSSCSFRVRMAIFLKEIPCDLVLLDLLKKEHLSDEYKKINNSSLVPALKLDNGKIITQSLAILNYLDEIYPQKSLWPQDSLEKAEILSFCLTIGMDIQPLNNLRVLNEIEEKNKQRWIEKWTIIGFDILDKILEQNTGPYCFGKNLSMADLFLYPQLYNAQRFNIDINPYKNLKMRYDFLSTQSFVNVAHPKNY